MILLDPWLLLLALLVPLALWARRRRGQPGVQLAASAFLPQAAPRPDRPWSRAPPSRFPSSCAALSRQSSERCGRRWRTGRGWSRCGSAGSACATSARRT